MADPILLIQGDTPSIRANLTREDTSAIIDLTDATVKLHFRKKRTTTLLFTIDGTSDAAQASAGSVDFNFSAVQTNLDPGKYEAEVEIIFDNGNRETVFEILEFQVREDFA